MNRSMRTRFTLTIVAAALIQGASGVALAQGGGQNGPRQQDQREQHQQQGHDQKHGATAAPGKDHRQDQSPRENPERMREFERQQAPGNSANAHAYALEQQDRTRLKHHYQRVLGRVDRAHRPHFEPGHAIPLIYRAYITPAPLSLRRHLPPPPPGYVIGYYQGYTVVYDPTTFVIITIVDLLLLP
ncbi:hypothetical protein E4T66_08700 [Sinimarinibacterium sp. CAU 1509]|uniref:hypothetical protein n=1 Tax=Sinimarinibacterium sp. CAU 1509 TaxID=2562283 RepID=UPI0010AD6574|nr:hypothetical protein [Sinimarinibacterium sp. CAU 1509]TJY62288.1 hypothetical protein E4T66_08700 [Sinimarinibacterium sp. CAU 1509]